MTEPLRTCRALALLLVACGALEAQEPLAAVKRIYVDKLVGGETAAHMRELLIASLQASQRFTLTENPERADAVLRGAAQDVAFTDTFQSQESLRAGTNLGRNSSARTGPGGRMGITLSEEESVRIAERKHEAIATVRLVSKEGDVIWATTQESHGAKFRGASADVADRITKRLLLDLDRAGSALARTPR